MAETESQELARESGREEVHVPFFPDFALREALTAFAYLTVLIIVASLTRPELTETANPNSTGFIPRPEWYFLWLFQLLKYFKGGWEPIGAVALPTLAIAGLISLPFLDKRKPKPRPLLPGTRPIRLWPRITGAAVILFLGSVTLAGLRSTAPAASKAPEMTAAQASGKALFEKMGCITCHVMGDKGGKRGPNLSHFGSGVNAQDKVLLHFAGFGSAPGSTMPGYQLSPEELHSLAEYLMSLK